MPSFGARSGKRLQDGTNNFSCRVVMRVLEGLKKATKLQQLEDLNLQDCRAAFSKDMIASIIVAGLAPQGLMCGGLFLHCSAQRGSKDDTAR